MIDLACVNFHGGTFLAFLMHSTRRFHPHYDTPFSPLTRFLLHLLTIQDTHFLYIAVYTCINCIYMYMHAYTKCMCVYVHINTRQFPLSSCMSLVVMCVECMYKCSV